MLVKHVINVDTNTKVVRPVAFLSIAFPAEHEYILLCGKDGTILKRSERQQVLNSSNIVDITFLTKLIVGVE